MIETAMLVTLGFCIATLLALVVLPLVTRRAGRLAAERLREAAPLSADEIVAERDGLRAAAAVEQRRLEQKLDDAQAAAAGWTAELGRRTAELASLQDKRQTDQAERDALAEDLGRARARLAELESLCDDLQRQVGDAGARLQEGERERRALAAQRDEIEALAEARRGTIAGLETRCSGLEMRRDDLAEEVARQRVEQDRLQAALTDVTRERDIARVEVQVVATQRAILQDDLTEATRRAETYRLRFDAKSEALERTEQKLVTEKADRMATQAALADLKRRFQSLEARLIEQGGKAADASDDSELDALRAEITRVADQALEVLGAGKPRAVPGASNPAAERGMP